MQKIRRAVDESKQQFVVNHGDEHRRMRESAIAARSGAIQDSKQYLNSAGPGGPEAKKPVAGAPKGIPMTMIVSQPADQDGAQAEQDKSTVRSACHHYAQLLLQEVRYSLFVVNSKRTKQSRKLRRLGSLHFPHYLEQKDFRASRKTQILEDRSWSSLRPLRQPSSSPSQTKPDSPMCLC